MTTTESRLTGADVNDVDSIVIERSDPNEILHTIQQESEVLFTWDYKRSRPALVKLYEKAKRSQWNATTDLPWETEVDREKLAVEFPTVPQYRIGLGASYCNFGAMLFRDGGQPGESLGWFEKAIGTLTAVYEQDRRLVQAKEFLRKSHWNRALAYDRLRKFTEAIKDWDKAIELSPMAEQPELRAVRAKLIAKLAKTLPAKAEPKP